MKRLFTLCTPFRIIGIVIFLLCMPLLLSLVGLIQWSPVNCWYYDVDIHSGRIRYTRYIAFIKISHRIDESALSNELLPEDLREVKPNWQRALTLSPGVRHSPHYIYHSAIAQIYELELIWKMGEFTPAARRSSAKRVLELWQKGQRDDAVNPFLHALSKIASHASSQEKVVDEKDLPPH